MINEKVCISSDEGLHARPAMSFCETAMKFNCDITVNKDGNSYDAKSILSVLCMGAMKGDIIELQADGDDEQEAVKALVEVLEKS